MATNLSAKARLANLSLGVLLAATAATAAKAQDAAEEASQTPAETIGPSAPEPLVEAAEETGDEDRFPLPIWGEQAEARGMHLPPPIGLGIIFLSNDLDLTADHLAVALKPGEEGPPPDADLFEVPQVTVTALKNETTGKQIKGDVWLFPFLNLFVTLGEVHGEAQVDITIDLDALLPFPFCRPAKPCGVQPLSFEAKVDNKTSTFGALAVYGVDKWFISASAAKTISIAKSSERSDVESLFVAGRTGIRFPLDDDTFLAPYVGVSYYDLSTELEGLVHFPGILPTGDDLGLRYRVDLSNEQKWSGIAGVNFEVSRLLDLQAEYSIGEGSQRLIASATFRFF